MRQHKKEAMATDFAALVTLLLLVLIYGFPPRASAQFHSTIIEDNVVLGQCFTDYDCLVYLVGNETLETANIRCNPANSRCEDYDSTSVNRILSTDPTELCTSVTMTVYGFNSVYLSDTRCDGMVIVHFDTAQVLSGFIRVYRSYSGMTTPTIATNFDEERFVNHPQKTFYFRGLCPDSPATSTGVWFVSQEMCALVDFVVIDWVDGNDFEWMTGLPGAPTTPSAVDWNGYGTFCNAPYMERTNNVANYYSAFKFWYMQFDNTGVDPPISNFKYQDTNSPVKAFRVPFGQVFSSSGTVLDTKYGDEMLKNNPGEKNGIKFPLTVYEQSDIPSTSRTLSYLSGSVVIQAGMGFAIRTVTGPSQYTLEFVKTVAGEVFEGLMCAPIYLNLSSVTGMSNIPGFIASPMYYPLEAVNLNTALVPTGQPDLFVTSGIDMFNNPKIRIYSTSTLVPSIPSASVYATCTSSFTVKVDYSAFGINLGTGHTATFYKVNTTTEPMTVYDPFGDGSNVVFPADTIVTMVLPGTGFYCVHLDGFLNYNELQSCFEVGKLSAELIQSRAYPPSPYDLAPDYVTILGYGTYINLDLKPILPPVIVAQRGLDVRLRVDKYTPNATLTQYLATVANGTGAQFDIFQDALAETFLDDYYDIFQHGAITEYVLQRSRFNGVLSDISVMVPTGTSFFEETALVRIQLFNSTTNELCYSCNQPVSLNLLTHPRLRTRLEVDRATCPNERSLMVVFAVGGIPMVFDNPLFYSSLSGVEYFEPTTYFHRWRNGESGDTLFATLGGYRFPAPSNVEIIVETYDVAGNLAIASGYSQSFVAETTTQVLFYDQFPICFNLSQASNVTAYIEGVVSDNNPNTFDDLIYYWQPLDVYASELYNPNEYFFDIPSDCALYDDPYNMTELEVYDMCYQQVYNLTIGNLTIDLCDGCSNLPPVYPGAYGLTLISADDDAYWELVVWVSSGLVDPATNRSIYCRSANSTHIQVADPMTLQFANLRRASSNCHTTNCHIVEVRPIVKAPYTAYASLVDIDPNPPFGSAVAIGVTLAQYERVVNYGSIYEIGLSITDNELGHLFCPVTVVYEPKVRGPVIQVVRTTDSSCEDDTGSVTMFMSYFDPELTTPEPSREVCMFWRDRYTGASDYFNEFVLPVNSPTSTTIPYQPDFAETDGRFSGIRGGFHQVFVYDKCPTYDTDPSCNNECASMIDPDTLAFVVPNPDLAFQIREFEVNNFVDPGGGIVIDRVAYTPAACYGDSYSFVFDIYDELGNNNKGYPPYQVHLIEPVTHAVIAQGGGDGLIEDSEYTATVSGFRAKLFTLTFDIETGNTFGFRFSGNYTLVVSSLDTGCVRSFVTYIDIVNPFDVIISTINSTCAYDNGGMLVQVTGGSPFRAGELPTFSFPGPPGSGQSGLTRQQRYRFFWKKPSSPVNFTEEILPVLVPPGFYQLMVLDREGCPAYANATVYSPPPIVVTSVSSAGICQSSQQATLIIEASGGTGALYTMQNLTRIETGDTLNFEFVASFNKTTNFHIVDEVGCMLPTPVSFIPPDPGPVNLTLSVTDSCANAATGRIDVYTDDTVVNYEWTVNGIRLVLPVGPVITSLSGGSVVEVLATTIIGCVGYETLIIPTRPAIIVTQVARSKIGTFDPPCVDTIELSITGGFGSGSGYSVALVDDPTNATLWYDPGNGTVYAYNVCRSYQYIFEILDSDGNCPIVFVSTDVFFGSSQSTGIPGLEPYVIQDDVVPYEDTTITTGSINGHTGPKNKIGAILSIVFASIILLVFMAFFITVLLFRK